MSQSLKATSPARELPLPPAQPRLPPGRSAGKELWIAVHLADLPLAALESGVSSEPVAVIEPRSGDLRIVAVNASAAGLGITPGLTLDAALALGESLRLLERSPRAEREQLDELAASAIGFTPTVSLEPPEALLLEVGASLKLFGGLAAIKAALAEELQRRRLKFRIACAPTPLASLWLVRAQGKDAGIEELTGRLSELDLCVTRWPEKIQSRLRAMGIRTVGDCLRLPRDGFARRASQACLLSLDRALGKQFDPRPPFRPYRRLSSKMEFFEETRDSSVFLQTARCLVIRLCEALRRRQAQASSLEIVFHHLHHASTVERISLAEPTHEPSRFMRLIEEKLSRVFLPAPVLAMGLRTGRLRAIDWPDVSLFSSHEREHAELTLTELVELLRMRFGRERVYRIGLAAEHRPEKAWRKLIDEASPAAAVDVTQLPACCRPLWLLRRPMPLCASMEEPRYQGPLRLELGPERIETGWWDDDDAVRDYYQARTVRGESLWIFQERLERNWYLHGIFG